LERERAKGESSGEQRAEELRREKSEIEAKYLHEKSVREGVELELDVARERLKVLALSESVAREESDALRSSPNKDDPSPSDVADMRDKLQANQTELAHLVDSLASARSDAARRSEALEAAGSALRRAEASAAKEKEDADALRKQVESHKREADTLRQRVGDLSGETRALRDDVQLAGQRAAEAAAARQVQAEALGEAHQKIDALQGEVGQLEGAKSSLNANVARLEADVARLEADLAQRGEGRELKDRDGSDEEMAHLRSEVHRLEGILSARTNQLEQAETRVTAAERRLEEAEGPSNTERIASLTAKLQQGADLIRTLRDQVAGGDTSTEEVDTLLKQLRHEGFDGHSAHAPRPPPPPLDDEFPAVVATSTPPTLSPSRAQGHADTVDLLPELKQGAADARSQMDSMTAALNRMQEEKAIAENAARRTEHELQRVGQLHEQLRHGDGHSYQGRERDSVESDGSPSRPLSQPQTTQPPQLAPMPLPGNNYEYRVDPATGNVYQAGGPQQQPPPPPQTHPQHLYAQPQPHAQVGRDGYQYPRAMAGGTQAAMGPTMGMPNGYGYGGQYGAAGHMGRYAQPQPSGVGRGGMPVTAMAPGQMRRGAPPGYRGPQDGVPREQMWLL